MSEILKEQITRRGLFITFATAALAAGCGNRLIKGEREATMLAAQQAQEISKNHKNAIYLSLDPTPQIIENGELAGFPILSKGETVLLPSQDNSGVYMFVGLGDQVKLQSDQSELLKFDKGTIITFGSITTANRGNIQSEEEKILKGIRTIVYQTSKGVSVGTNFPNISDKESFNQLIGDQDIIGFQLLIANSNTGEGSAWTFMLPQTF